MKVSTSVLLAAATLAIPLAAFAYTGENLEKTVKVSASQAKAIALKKERGTIVDMELERETGGSGMRYTFTLNVKGITREVGVDANSGAVLEDTLETANDKAD